MFKIKSISNLISCVSSRAIIYAQALRHAPGWGWVTPISIQSVNFCLPAGKGGCFFFYHWQHSQATQPKKCFSFSCQFFQFCLSLYLRSSVISTQLSEFLACNRKHSLTSVPFLPLYVKHRLLINPSRDWTVIYLLSIYGMLLCVMLI